MLIGNMNREEIGESLVRPKVPDRRKRVNRLKKLIVVAIVCAILIPIILCIILLGRVGGLEKKSERLGASRERMLTAGQVRNGACKGAGRV